MVGTADDDRVAYDSHLGQRDVVAGPVGDPTPTVTEPEAPAVKQEPHLYMFSGSSVPDGPESGFLPDRVGICGSPD